MAVRAPTLSVDDQEYYPLHEEDDVREIPSHHRRVNDLYDALRVRFPGWFITSNVCIYWERGNTRDCRAPDVLVVSDPLTEEAYRVYQTWRQPPVTFVAEIGSRSTFREDEGPKVEIYQDLIRVGEYLYADPPNGLLRLWRLGPDGYLQVTPETNGRLRSQALALEFVLEAGELRAYTLDGQRLLTHTETDAARQTAEAAQQATEAARQAAEAARQVAEARAAELERQLADLRAQRGED